MCNPRYKNFISSEQLVASAPSGPEWKAATAYVTLILRPHNASIILHIWRTLLSSSIMKFDFYNFTKHRYPGYRDKDICMGKGRELAQGTQLLSTRIFWLYSSAFAFYPVPIPNSLHQAFLA